MFEMKCNKLYNEIKKGRFMVTDNSNSESGNNPICNCSDCKSLLVFMHKSLLIDNNNIEVKPFLYTRIMSRMENHSVNKRKSFQFVLQQAYVIILILFCVGGGIIVGNISSDKIISNNETSVTKTLNENFFFSDLEAENNELFSELESNN